MACGLPVVASDVGGALDFIEDGQNGALFQSEDANHLSQILAQLMATPERWNICGQRGRQAASAWANLSDVTDRVEAIYSQLRSS